MSPDNYKPIIKFNDLLSANSMHLEKLSDVAAQTIKSGWYIGGKNCYAFEEEFAAYIGCKHVMGVGNGTDALEIAIRSLELSTDQSVLTVANAGFYTSTAAKLAGVNLEFIDIDLATKLIDVSQLSEHLSHGNIGAVVVTHLYGLCADMAPIVVLCKEHDVPLIEDCAQAHGAERDGQKAGSFGDISTFSFYPTKNLGAIGDGGAIATNSPDIAKRVKQLKQYGWGEKYHVEMIDGCNSRLDEIQAAFLRIKLKSLDKENVRRRDIANRYSLEIINSNIETPPCYGLESVAHLYVVHASNREALQTYLKLNNIQTDRHYPIPDHKQSVMAASLGKYSSLKNTEYSASHCLSLPCHLGMSDDDVSWVIKTINAWI